MSCHRCGSHTCNHTCDTVCDTGCGCPTQVKGSCVFYQGANLACINATKGDTYDSILVNINDIVCDIIAPSGMATSVTSDCGNITVTESSVSGGTNYDICIDSTITDQIDTNTSTIVIIQNCLANTVEDIVSDTITITEESSDSCGRTLRLEIPTPSGTPVYDGIIYNDITKVGCVNGGTTQTLKNFNWDYDTNNLIANGDEIRFRATGQVAPVGENVDIVKIEVWDSGVTMLYGESFAIFGNTYPLYSWIIEGWITKGTSTDDALLHIEAFSNTKDNGVQSKLSNNLSNIDEDLSGVNWGNLEIKVLYVHNSITAPAATNFARQLMVEVVKKIV